MLLWLEKHNSRKREASFYIEFSSGLTRHLCIKVGDFDNNFFSTCYRVQVLYRSFFLLNTQHTFGRYTWRHSSALSFIAQTLQSVKSTKLYADLPGYLSPCTTTGDSLCPAIILSTADNFLYVIESTVGFETNLSNNARRKELKYRPPLTDLANDYKQVKFINHSINCLDIFGNSSDSFRKLCMERGINNGDLNFIISKISSIIIRSTYYIFCMRNKPWSNSPLLSY